MPTKSIDLVSLWLRALSIVGRVSVRIGCRAIADESADPRDARHNEGHVIVRETEREAWAAVDDLIRHLDERTVAAAQGVLRRMESG